MIVNSYNSSLVYTRRIILLLLLAISLILFLPSYAHASSNSLILITEVQVGQGSKEFIEILNISDQDLDLSKWRLQYHNSTSEKWTNKTLTFLDPEDTFLASGDRTILISKTYELDGANPVATFSSGLADGGGYIRLIPQEDFLSQESVVETEEDEPNEEVDPVDDKEELENEESTQPDEDDEPSLESYGDHFEWGLSVAPECLLAPAHAEGASFKRFPSGDGVLVDTDVSGQDFYVSNRPSPSSIDSEDPFSIDEVEDYCGMPSQEEDDPEAPGIVEDPKITKDPVVYLRILITELFTDPVSPQTDSEDEYIELFNPNDTAVNLLDYKLFSGLNSTYSYTFGEVVLQPGEYFALSRRDSKLTLSNTSSKAVLHNPNGDIVSETAPYDKSYQAQSWQLYSATWQWSTTPTPSSANIQTTPTSATTLAKKTTTKPAQKTTTPKKATTKKTTTAKPTQAKKVEGTSAFTVTDDQGNTKIQPYIIWGAGALLFGYGLWEYRLDLLGFIKRRDSH